MSWQTKTFTLPVCDRCGTAGDADECTWWETESEAAEYYAENHDWFFGRVLWAVVYGIESPTVPKRRYHYTEVVCPKCQTCDVCDAKWVVVIDDHMVCEDHEDHEFPQCPECKSFAQPRAPYILALAGAGGRCGNEFHQSSENLGRPK